MTTNSPRPPLKQRSPWLWGCQTVFLSFVALCVIIILVHMHIRFGWFRMYHGEVEIEPYVKTYLGSNDDTLQGYYHLYCYRKAIDNEKHNLKKILVFFQDTTTKKTILDNKIELHKHITDYYSEFDSYWFEERDYYKASYIDSDPTYFDTFSTWADPQGGRVPRRASDFTRETIGKDFIISFPYDKFNVQVWQKFIDIKDHDQWYYRDTVDRVYKLKNPQTDSIECSIETKKFPDGNWGFKMEIL